jgi:hypothetical protein
MQNYLQQILIESNTIIIPGFGALTITSTKTGDIYFMPFLKHDDGLLAKYIAKAESIEIEEAKRTIVQFIEDIEATITKSSFYEMEEFGRFKKNNEGELEFQRWEDYQVKDTTILSKKVKERKNTKEKDTKIEPTNTQIENPIINTSKINLDEPIKTDEEIHQQIENELPLSSNPIHLSIEETVIHPIEETYVSNSMEDEIVSESENNSIEIDTLQNENNDAYDNAYITLIEDTNSDSNNSDNSHHPIKKVDETNENLQIIMENEEHSIENSLETIIQTKEDKKALRKKLKNEKAAAKAAEKRLKKGYRPEIEEIVPQKEKKKSRSMILWIASAILITVVTMWYIKKERDSKVHLTVIDKKESKIITNKVIEKKELHKELSKQTKSKEVEKESISPKITEVKNTKTEDKINSKTLEPHTSTTTSINPKPIDNSKINTTKLNVKSENSSITKSTTTAPKINSVIISSTPIIPPVPAPQKAPAPPNPNPAYTSPNKNIQVIVGTFKDKASAEQLLNTLKTDGFNTAYSKELNGTYQVSLGSFTTLSESKNALQKYRGVKD